MFVRVFSVWLVMLLWGDSVEIMVLVLVNVFVRVFGLSVEFCMYVVFVIGLEGVECEIVIMLCL